jgi:ProP effector
VSSALQFKVLIFSALFMIDPVSDTAAQDPSAGPQATARTPAKEASGNSVSSGSPGKGSARQMPNAPRQPNPVLERLFALYPKMFGAKFLPLKLGVYQELVALHPDEFKKEDLKLALGQHARSTRYLEAVANHSKRYDLQGEPVEDLAPEHVHHAIWEVYRRRQARSRENLGPLLLERIVAAIEASGLDATEYAERVRTQDESASAALHDALALLAERVAKREALLRAYDASGSTPAAFGQMYGIDLPTIEWVLAHRNRAEPRAPNTAPEQNPAQA